MFSFLTLSQTVLTKKSWVRGAGAIIAGSLFLALSAKINIPFWPVRISMQSFAVIFLSALYGRNLATATVAAYILEGALGIPIFQRETAGVAYLFSPTGGYILGFLIASFVVGSLADRGWGKTHLSAAGLFITGALVIDLPGLVWLKTFVDMNQLFKIWLSYQVAFILKTGLGATLVPLVKNQFIKV